MPADAKGASETGEAQYGPSPPVSGLEGRERRLEMMEPVLTAKFWSTCALDVPLEKHLTDPGPEGRCFAHGTWPGR